MASMTSAVYINIIEDVINKVRDEFIQSGGEENALHELQGLWELKMMQCGGINGPIERSSLPKPIASSSGQITPVHDLNVPYEGTEEFQTPTADILFPPTPLETPIQTPLPGTADNSYYLLTPSEYSNAPDAGGSTEVKPGRPSSYMQPPSPWMNQRPLGVDVNVPYVEGRDEVDRGGSHQPMTQDFFMMSSGKRKREDFAPHRDGYIPQRDGAGDATFEVFQTELYPYQGVISDDYNAVNTPAGHDLQASTSMGTQLEGGEDDDEPPLNENDDDDLDDVDEGEEQNAQHLVLAQFDKVTRAKSRWKCTLKDGIIRVNNKDILFSKASGEFDF